MASYTSFFSSMIYPMTGFQVAKNLRCQLRRNRLLSPLTKLAIGGFLSWVALVCAPAETFGQINVSSNSGTGNWGVATTWSGGVVPHNAGANTYNAFINSSSTVNLNLARTVNQLTVFPGGVLNFTNGNILDISNNGQTGAGVVNNDGSININSTGSSTQFRFNGLTGTNFQLNGTGFLTLSGGNSAVLGGTNALLTQGAGHTIQGSGTVLNNGLAMINQGTIRARSGDNLRIDPPNVSVGGVFFQNDGLVQAQSGGTVTLVGTGGEFTGSGEYRAETGGTIALNQNVVMRNTRLTGGGQFTLGSGSHTWQSVNHSSNNTVVQSGNNLNLTNRLTNSGSLQIDSGASTTRMTINGDTILDGGGAIRMMGPNARITGDSVGTFVNFNNTISGTGLFGTNVLNIANQGTIQAGAGEVMTIDSRIDAGNPSAVTFNNSGLVRAFDGGRIVFNGAAGAIGGSGTYRAEANSIIEFTTNSRVFGGVYQGDGQFLASGNTNFGNIINQGNISIGNGATSTVSGPVTNNGNIQVASTGSPTNVSVQGTQTISGTGSLTLVGGNSNITGTGSLTNGVGHTITGGGNIGSTTLAVTNAGTITNIPGSSMNIRGDLHLAAGGRIVAANSPTFSFVFERPFIQTGGQVHLQQNSTVRHTSNSTPNMSGGFLSGFGTVQSNNFLFGGSSSLRPGNSAGQLNFDGDLTWGQGAFVQFDLGMDAATSDFISISGDLLKDGSGIFAFDFMNNGWVLDQTYDLMGFHSTDFVTTDFSFVSKGDFAGTFDITAGGQLLQFTVTSVPEPGTTTLLALACGLSMFRRRRS